MKLLSVVLSTVKKTHKEADRHIIGLEKVCKKGCDLCCFQIVSVNTWEEVRIVEHVRRHLDVGTKSILKHNLEKWFARFDGATREASDSSPLTPEEMGAVKRFFREQCVPCPMLIGSECAIYDVRPITCRVHIEPSDPENCRSNPHRVTTPEAGSVYQKSLRAFDPRVLPLLYTPVAYAVAGVLAPNLNPKPIRSVGVDPGRDTR